MKLRRLKVFMCFAIGHFEEGFRGVKNLMAYGNGRVGFFLGHVIMLTSVFEQLINEGCFAFEKSPLLN